jgi:hypothetical protein
MTGLVFLLVAVLISVLGSAILFLRHRDPTSLDHGVEEFQREMRALSPENNPMRRPDDRG